MLGLAALSPLAIAGSVLSMFTGGLAAALIVATAVTLTDRAQTRSVELLGGLAPRMPIITWVFVLAALALLGVPLMASFPAQTMILFGSFKTQPLGAFAVVAGLVLVAVALGILVHRVLFGQPNHDGPAASDACSALAEGYPLRWLTAVPTNEPLISKGALFKDCAQWALASTSLLYLAWLRLTVPGGGLPDLVGGRVENDPRSPGARC